MGCCISHQDLPALAFLGLCDSGKSTIIAYIQHHVFRLTHPTLGVQISTAVYQDRRVEIWDVSGRDCSYWSRYYNYASGIVFVVDASNEKDLETFVDYAKQALENKDVQKIPILIYMNKLEPENNDNFTHILSEKLDLSTKDLCINLVACDPKNGKGITEGFKWINEKMTVTS